MARLPAPLLLVLAILLVPPPAPAGAAGDPAERVPEDLPGDVASLRAGLEDAAEADDVEPLRAAVNGTQPIARDVLPLLRDLQGDNLAGDLVIELWTSLRSSARAGNVSDARSLAASAADTLEDDLAPRAAAWAENRTAVTVGRAQPGDNGGLVLPLVVLHPPPGGLGALDAGLALDPDRARPVDAALELGQGQTTVEPDNGTARAASFQADALAGLHRAGAPATVFARVDVDVVDLETGDGFDIAVDVHAAAVGGGEPLLVVAPDGTAEVPARAQGFLSDPPARWGGLAVVGLLGAGAFAAVRRLEV